MTARLPMDAVRAALQRGAIAVVLVEAAHDIERARAASRDICAPMQAALGMAGLHLSRSAAPGLVAVALCGRNRVGVDVERIRAELVDDDLLALALHPDERAAAPGVDVAAFFELWTRKEAVLKALGVGLAIRPAALSVMPSPDGWCACAPGVAGLAMVRNMPAPPGWCLAVASNGAAPRDVAVFEASAVVPEGSARDRH